MLAEDCRVLAEVLAETRTQEPGGAGLNIPRVLETYNERRHDDAIAACKISEMGMGNNRSMRLSFISQLALVSLLSKTLGRLFPKVHPCSVLCYAMILTLISSSNTQTCYPCLEERWTFQVQVAEPLFQSDLESWNLGAYVCTHLVRSLQESQLLQVR